MSLSLLVGTTVIIIPNGIINYKVNELHSLFIKFSAIGLLQGVATGSQQKTSGQHECYLVEEIVF